jgi:CubicO group peptidase (beta-lactamase class C family)
MHPTARSILLVLCLVCLPEPAFVVGATAARPLPRSTPEAQGMSSAGILAFVEEADRISDSLHSLMILRHGQVVAEGWWGPYDAASPHDLYSLSKSFASTAIGFAVQEGRLTVDDEVLKFFPEDAPAEPSANLKAMRVRDLLTMAAGHQDESLPNRDKLSPRAFLAHPVPHKPGTHFLYNTPATFMLSAIIQKVTGQTLLDYLRPRLFDPLGIENPTWDTNSHGMSLGGYGLSVRTEDIARFGQFYLQKGRWNGRQLLAPEWVAAATSRQVSNGSNPESDWEQGYGYQFWRCRTGVYRADGAFGQFCIVLPGHDAVIAITAGVKDMQAVLNLVWEKLLPAMHAGRLPRNRSAHQALMTRLQNLRVPVVAGSASSAAATAALGLAFQFPANEQKLEGITLERVGPSDTTLVLRVNGVNQRIVAGFQQWAPGRLQFAPIPERPVSVSGAWTSEDTFTLKICFTTSPYILTARLRLGERQVTWEGEYNVWFGSAKLPTLVGSLQ